MPHATFTNDVGRTPAPERMTRLFTAVAAASLLGLAACGGGSTSASPAPAPTPAPAPGNASAYLGCYVDSANRALPNILAASGATAASCIQAAKAASLVYAGLQYGGQCFGGGTLTSPQVSDSECNMPCTAAPGEACGGSYRNSVFATGLPAPPPPPPPPPPVPVGNCNNLPAMNQWEEITSLPALQDKGVLSVVIDPIDHATVYASLDLNGIYKSSDCGVSWTKLNTGRNGTVLDSGSDWVLQIDPTDNRILYTSPLYGSDLRLFKSVDGGRNWDPLFERGGNVEQALEYIFLQSVALDTANHLHVVANFHVNCVAPYRPICFAESNDGGATWQIINGPPEVTGWIEDAGVAVINGGIFFCMPFDGLFYSGDHGNSWKKLASQGYMHILHASDGAYYMGTAQGAVQRSVDLMNWEPVPGTPTTVSYALADDGQRLFAAARAYPMYVSAPLSDLTQWSAMPKPANTDAPGSATKGFAYDPVHHLLYSANQMGGLHRMVTR